MKALLIAAGALLLAACSPSTMNDTYDSSYYWPQDGSSAVLVSGELNDEVTGYAVGFASTRHLAIKFDDQLVAEGLLSDMYEGQLTGDYNGNPVNVICNNPVISGNWREVRCSVEVADSVVGLTF